MGNGQDGSCEDSPTTLLRITSSQPSFSLVGNNHELDAASTALLSLCGVRNGHWHHRPDTTRLSFVHGHLVTLALPDLMRILSHRGFWHEPSERNSLPALARSLDHGFGLETDVRDCGGRLVISHDVPLGTEAAFDKTLQLFHNSNLPLAVNIKADGLAVLLKRAVSTYNLADWFAFDMSIPDMRSYLDEKVPVFARVSEVEKVPPWIDEVAGIWYDSFSGTSYDAATIAGYLRAGKQVCIVSPELHRRPHQVVWRDIKALADQPALMLCTDYPEQARQFFITDPSNG